MRLSREGFVSEAFLGRAEDRVDEIAASLNPYGLHFAFLDPFNLDDLSFSIIERLAKLKRMDLLIHVSVQDRNRNLRRYMEEEGGALDRLRPSLRERSVVATVI